MLIWATGCTQENPTSRGVSFSGDQLHEDLQQMQGAWRSQHDPVLCTAQIEGYTIRLAYETSDGEIQSKRNACIRKLDAENHRLQIHGDKEPWGYLLAQRNSEVCLKLQFYDESRHQWVHSILQRIPEAGSVADL